MNDKADRSYKGKKVAVPQNLPSILSISTLLTMKEIDTDDEEC